MAPLTRAITRTLLSAPWLICTRLRGKGYLSTSGFTADAHQVYLCRPGETAGGLHLEGTLQKERLWPLSTGKQHLAPRCLVLMTNKLLKDGHERGTSSELRR